MNVPPPQSTPRLLYLFLLAVTLVLLGLQLRSGVEGPFDVDEFGLLQLGRSTCERGLAGAPKYKVGASLIACGVQRAGRGDAVHTLMAARLTAFFFQLFFLAALYAFVRRAFDPQTAVLALLLAVTQFHWVDQGFRFRTELLTAGLFLLGYEALLARRELVAAVLMMAALGIHDKSVYHLLPALAFVAPEPRAWVRWLAPLALAAVVFSLTFHITPWSLVALRTGNPSHIPFGSFYQQAAVRSLPVLALAAWGLYAANDRLRWGAAAAATLFYLAAHPAPFPFFFLFAVGITAALAARGAAELLKNQPSRGAAWAVAVLLVLATAPPALARMERNAAAGNAYELRVAERLEAYARGGAGGYFDGVGMLVTQAQDFDRFLDQNSGRIFVQDPAAVPKLTARLDEQRTATVVLTRALYSMPPPFFAWLNANFVPDWGNVWVRGVNVGAQESTLTVVIPGAYEILAEQPPLIDGQPAAGCCRRLEKGSHTFQAATGAPVQLRLRPPDWSREAGRWPPQESRMPFATSWALQWDDGNRGWIRW